MWCACHDQRLLCRGLAEPFTSLELLDGEIDFDARRQAIPSMPLPGSAPVARDDDGDQNFASEVVANDESSNGTLSAGRIRGRPFIRVVGGLATPSATNCRLELN